MTITTEPLIIVGPDRALWFTANCAVSEVAGPCEPIFVKLVRITTSGAMTVESGAGDTSEGTFQSALTSGANNTIWAAIGLGLSVGSNGGGYEEVNARRKFVDHAKRRDERDRTADAVRNDHRIRASDR